LCSNISCWLPALCAWYGFHQERTPRFLTAGFFLFGLALWDKALFVWMLSAMVIAAALVLTQELWKSLNLRNLIMASMAFCLGAAPLIFYNVTFPLETFRSNTGFDSGEVPAKTGVLLSTFSGVALLGYIPRNDPAGHPRDPRGMIENIAIRISNLTGGPIRRILGLRASGGGAAISLAVAHFRPQAYGICLDRHGCGLDPDAVRKRGGRIRPPRDPPMAVSRLLRRRGVRRSIEAIGPNGKPLLAAVLVYLVGANALVTNEYFSRLVRNGSGETWTDAVYPLSDSLRRVKARTIYINDWGILDVLRLLNRGRLPLRVGSDPLTSRSSMRRTRASFSSGWRKPNRSL